MSSVNASEKYVHNVCQSSFLNLWCERNPRIESGKELCDVLVVCDPDVILISVKEIFRKDSGDLSLDLERWKRRAVDESIKQIYGAQRRIESMKVVIRHDGTPGLDLPSLESRNLHRIAVAFGSREEAFIRSGDYGKGYVHVMCERSFWDVLTELDTITDFVSFLRAKENCQSSIICEGSESNLLGWYLFNEKSFPTEPDVMFFDNTIWDGVQKEEAFLRKKKADKDSYIWDRLIETLSKDEGQAESQSGMKLTDLELVLRVMARESRFSRRMLGKAIHNFIELSRVGKIRSRIMRSDHVIYVFVFFSKDEKRENRIEELMNRCFIALNMIREKRVVIGIGIGEFNPDYGSASDIVYLESDHWSSDDVDYAKELQLELGYFKNAIESRLSEDEYPPPSE